jgi:hypothetical protein
MGRFTAALALLAISIGTNAQIPTLPTPHGPLEIHPSGQPNKCLEVRGGVFANGTPVQM